MKKSGFYFSSADEKARMRAVEWIPEGEPKAVFHMFYGAAKPARCQEDLAEYFKAHGFVVVESACPESATGLQVQEAMHICLNGLKRKYPDVPYLLVGLAQGASGVRAYLNNYPGAVEGAILSDAGQEQQVLDKNIPVLQVPAVEENHQEAFRYIYRWTEERLDEMLYRAATKY